MASTQPIMSQNFVDKKALTSKKLVRAKRCIRGISITSVILSLISLGYGIYFTITCRNTFREYKCAVTEGKSACSGSAEIIVASGISLVCMIGALGGHAHLRNALYVAATVQAIFGGLILVLSADTDFLTEGTADQMYSEMSECRHSNSSDVTSGADAECWDLYRENFCEDWLEAEKAICENIHTTTSYNATIQPTSMNKNTKEIIDGCVTEFEQYAVQKYYFYTERAYPEMLIMAGLYLLLATVLLLVGRKYEQEKTRLRHELELQTRAAAHPGDRQNSRSVHHPTSYKALDMDVNGNSGNANGENVVEMEDPLAETTGDKTKLVQQSGLKNYKYKNNLSREGTSS